MGIQTRHMNRYFIVRCICLLAMLATLPGVAEAQRPIEDLVKILRDADKSKSTRMTAIIEIGNISPKERASGAIPALTPLLNDSDMDIRRLAIISLGKIGNADAVKPLADAFEDAQQAKRSNTDPEDRLRLEIVIAFGKIGPAAKAMIPRVLDVALHGNETINMRSAAVEALVGITESAPDPESAVPAMLQILWAPAIPVLPGGHPAMGGGTTSHSVAAGVLGRLGPAGKGAVPDLILIVRGDSAKYQKHTVRHYQDRAELLAVINALGAIGPDAEAALPSLRELLSDDDSAVNQAAERAVAKIKR